jgi:hypothetical protein
MSSRLPKRAAHVAGWNLIGETSNAASYMLKTRVARHAHLAAIQGDAAAISQLRKQAIVLKGRRAHLKRAINCMQRHVKMCGVSTSARASVGLACG